MKLGNWTQQLAISANTQTATANSSQATSTKLALITALAISVLLTVISLFVPPFIDNDSADGFLAWRGTLLGAANSIITPDQADIARDTVRFLTLWSPGQYVIPGVISLLLGVPLGVAMTITVGLSLLASLIGWVIVVRTFAPRSNLTVAVVVLIGFFHYSTHGFVTYHGGEILLQAATPWLLLTAYRIPAMDTIPATLLAAGAVFVAFFVKLTGLIVITAALVAGSLVCFAFSRRITHGMIGGALGAVAAFIFVWVSFLLKGTTAAYGTEWSVPLENILYSSLALWIAGISWSAISYLILRTEFYVPVLHMACLIPPALLVASLVLFWRPATSEEKKFKHFSLWCSAIIAVAFILLFVLGAAIEPEERHFRSAGTLLFVCALVSATAPRTPRWAKGGFLFVCGFMAFFGLASFAFHELATAKGQWLDRMSWTNQNMTNQKIFDLAAVEFLREVFAREGRSALIVLPSSQLAVTLPTETRILAIDFNWATELEIQDRRYSGRVPGHLYVLLPNTIIDAQSGHLDMSKGQALLSDFIDYAPNAWKRKTFTTTSVFFQ